MISIKNEIKLFVNLIDVDQPTMMVLATLYAAINVFVLSFTGLCFQSVAPVCSLIYVLVGLLLIENQIYKLFQGAYNRYFTVIVRIV